MALALWFSATAIMPSLKLEFALSDDHAALLTSSVAVGFVCGTLVSAIFGLSDRIAPRRLFMISAFVAAAANGAILLVEPTS
jgi:nitrate/nitrite transporter NarK